MVNTAYIFDAVRTPRGKGKKDVALHESKPVQLGAGLLTALQRRHDLDTARVDDVVLGCVSPVGEQGGDIAKAIVQYAGWDESVAGVQLDRFCASGLEAVNTAASRVVAGGRFIGGGWRVASSPCRACKWARRAAPGRRATLRVELEKHKQQQAGVRKALEKSRAIGGVSRGDGDEIAKL